MIKSKFVRQLISLSTAGTLLFSCFFAAIAEKYEDESVVLDGDQNEPIEIIAQEGEETNVQVVGDVGVNNGTAVTVEAEEGKAEVNLEEVSSTEGTGISVDASEGADVSVSAEKISNNSDAGNPAVYVAASDSATVEFHTEEIETGSINSPGMQIDVSNSASVQVVADCIETKAETAVSAEVNGKESSLTLDVGNVSTWDTGVNANLSGGNAEININNIHASTGINLVNDGGKASVNTGDAEAFIAISVDATNNSETEVKSGTIEGHSLLGARVHNDNSLVKITTGDINDSKLGVITRTSGGGKTEINTGNINTNETAVSIHSDNGFDNIQTGTIKGGFGIEAQLSNRAEAEVSSDSITAFWPVRADVDDSTLNIKANKIKGTEAVYAEVTNGGTMSLDVDTIESERLGIQVENAGGNVNVSVNSILVNEDEYYAQGIEALTGEKGNTKIDIGDLSVVGNREATGICVRSDGFEECGGTADVAVRGKLIASSSEGFATAVVLITSEEKSSAESSAKIDIIKVVADGKEGATGINVNVGQGNTEITVHEEIEVSSSEGRAWGLDISSNEGGSINLQALDSVKIESGSIPAFENIESGGLTAAGNSGTMEISIGKGVEVVAGDNIAVGMRAETLGEDMDMEVNIQSGGIIAEGNEASQGVNAFNGEGKLNITVAGDINSSGTGVHIQDAGENILSEKIPYDGYMRPEPGEELYYDPELDATVYMMVVDGDEVFYAVNDENEIIEKWKYGKLKGEDKGGTTCVEIKGDVAGKKEGAKISIESDASLAELIVDGTLSGDESSVVITNETKVDNIVLTVWEIKPNKENNLVERIIPNELEDKNEETKREGYKEVEDKIQYIIRIEQPEVGSISAGGDAFKYKGYDVAKEGDTVLLKVDIPEGYRVANAYNGTETKVELLKNGNGEYYLVVPRGGAVLLSVVLERIPEIKTRQIQTAKLTYYFEGGTIQGSSAPIEVKAHVGDYITLLEAPVREGYEFLYWNVQGCAKESEKWKKPDPDSDKQYSPGSRIHISRKEMTICAVWKKK